MLTLSNHFCPARCFFRCACSSVARSPPDRPPRTRDARGGFSVLVEGADHPAAPRVIADIGRLPGRAGSCAKPPCRGRRSTPSPTRSLPAAPGALPAREPRTGGQLPAHHASRLRLPAQPGPQTRPEGHRRVLPRLRPRIRPALRQQRSHLGIRLLGRPERDQRDRPAGGGQRPRPGRRPLGYRRSGGPGRTGPARLLSGARRAKPAGVR